MASLQQGSHYYRTTRGPKTVQNAAEWQQSAAPDKQVSKHNPHIYYGGGNVIDMEKSHLPMTDEAREKFNRLYEEILWKKAYEKARAELAAQDNKPDSAA
jgi:hypothetical protein